MNEDMQKIVFTDKEMEFQTECVADLSKKFFKLVCEWGSKIKNDSRIDSHDQIFATCVSTSMSNVLANIIIS